MVYISDPDFVCSDCFNDDGIKSFVEAHAESDECTFCGTTAEKPIAAPIEDVVEHISNCIGRYFEDPAENLPYESAEGGYQGITYTTYEVFDEVGLDFPKDTDGRLRQRVDDGLENDLWAEVDPFSLSPAQQLAFSWEHFCEIIKHNRRFFFLQTPRPVDEEELYGPARILEIVVSYAKQAGAFVTLPKGTRLFRARRQPAGTKYASAGTLGPPPVEHAIQTNRMSPSGVVMTYAADDPPTALAETADKPGTYAIGEFVTERDALILDLTNLPQAPSIFEELPEEMAHDPRPRLNFLNQLRREISKPIARDDRVHIEYVPTQVVTEYVRTIAEINGQHVDGIRYASSRRNAQTALVLFADQDNLILEKVEQHDFYHLAKDRWLRLKTRTEKKLSAKDIQDWAKPWFVSGLAVRRRLG